MVLANSFVQGCLFLEFMLFPSSICQKLFKTVDLIHSAYFDTQFLPSSSRVNTAVWMHYLDANKTAGEKARRQLQKNAASNLEQVMGATPHKAPTVRPPTSHHENYPS